MLNIVFLGPPGCGKGTQAQKIIEHYHLVHLSTGDIFRAEIKAGTALGKLCQSLIDKGNFVPDSVVLKELYRRALEQKHSGGIIFDGFPRNIWQGEMFSRLLKKKKLPISLVIYLDVPEEELFKRLLLRAKLQGRADDTEEVIRKRLEIYRKETEPLVEFYRSQRKLVEVNGYRDVDNVAESIFNAIDRFVIEHNINISKK